MLPGLGAQLLPSLRKLAARTSGQQEMPIADSPATPQRLVNTGPTRCAARRDSSTARAASQPALLSTARGERNPLRRPPPAHSPPRAEIRESELGAEQEETPQPRPRLLRLARGEGRHGQGRWLALRRPEGRWTCGLGRRRGPFTTHFLRIHLRRAAAAGGAMDLTGLLLDEEGTFSLTGFQDFSVSTLPTPAPASPHWEPGSRAHLSGPSGPGSSPDSLPWS